MTVDKLRYAQYLMADRSHSIPAVCRELGDIPSSTLYHYLHADESLKEPGRKLLDCGPPMSRFRTFMQGDPICHIPVVDSVVDRRLDDRAIPRETSWIGST